MLGWLAEQQAHRRGDRGRRQAGGRHLVEQRLEQVVVGLVDDGDVDRRRRCSLRAASRPPKPQPMITMWGGRRRVGVLMRRMIRSRRARPASCAKVARSTGGRRCGRVPRCGPLSYGAGLRAWAKNLPIQQWRPHEPHPAGQACGGRAARSFSIGACAQPGTGGAALGRGPVHPVDARRQPDQVAPGAHHLVLRDRAAAAACDGLPRLRCRASTTSSIPTTRRSARATRGRSAGC